MAILDLKNVSKSFGQLKVTDDVSFSVADREALALIRPTGTRKST